MQTQRFTTYQNSNQEVDTYMLTRTPVGKPRSDTGKEELENQSIRMFNHKRATHLCMIYLEDFDQIFTMKTKDKAPHASDIQEGKEIILRHTIRES